MVSIYTTMPTRNPAPPTTTLPPLSRLSTYSSEKIASALANLRALYWPPAPLPLPKNIAIPKRSIPTDVLLVDSPVSPDPDSGYASVDEEEEDESGAKIYSEGVKTEIWDEPERDLDSDSELELLRNDPFERTFAIKWITGFVARSDGWISLSSVDEHEQAGGGTNVDWDETDRRTSILEDATAILAAFTVDEEEDCEDDGLTRTFNFALPSLSNKDEGCDEDNTIRVELNDAPLSNVDHTSVGLQSWGSSIVLAERIASSPATFSLSPTSGDDLILKRPLRILELGAGTGLLSILTAKLLQRQRIASRSTVVATDYHPDVLENLQKNVKTNFSEEVPITVSRLDWECPVYVHPLDEQFDIILAADVIYHPDHAGWIRTCVEYLLRPPSHDYNGRGQTAGDKGGVFWLMIPIRSVGRHEGLHTTVDALFPVLGEEESTEILGRRLVTLERFEIEKQGNIGRADESGYMLFRIGWVH